VAFSDHVSQSAEKSIEVKDGYERSLLPEFFIFLLTKRIHGHYHGLKSDEVLVSFDAGNPLTVQYCFF